jgi:Ca-activated chloride channel family protein
MINWFKHIEFANAEYFWLLLIIPFVLAFDYFKEGQSKFSISTGQQLPIGNYPIRHINKLFKTLAFVALIAALARPQLPLSWSNVKTEGIDIMLALDMSGSMLAEDFEPNRLEASKAVAMDFIRNRPNDRIGLVVYSGETFTQCPLTTDHAVLLNLFHSIQYGIIEDGTAIGLGLANAVNRLKESEAKSKVVILLTDGENNKGSIPPLTASDIAKQFGIRVYTIGVGKNGKARMPVGENLFGRMQYEEVPVKIDEEILTQIANNTGGKYFRATDNESLSSIYEEIDLLEKTITQETEYEEKDEQFYWFAFACLFFFFIEFIFNKLIFKSIV